MRRAGCLVAAVLFLSAIGAATLLSFALGRAGIVSGLAQLSVLVVVAAIGLLLFSMMFLRVMRRVGSPIADIVEAADRVASSDFSVRIAERGPPPLRSVAHAFNKMTDRLQAQDRQRRHLMADIAHELRTPLTVVQGRLEGLLDGVYPRDDAHVSEVLADTRILGRLIDDLRTLASSESGALSLQREATDLVVLVHDVVRSLAADAQGAGVTIRIGESMNLPLADVDPLRIREVVVNLVTNALHHTPAGGVVSIDGEAKNDRVVTLQHQGARPLRRDDRRRHGGGRRRRRSAEDLRSVLQGGGIARFGSRPHDRAQPDRGPRWRDSCDQRTGYGNDDRLHPSGYFLIAPDSWCRNRRRRFYSGYARGDGTQRE